MSLPIKPARNPRWDVREEPQEYDAEVAEILSEIQSVTAVAQLESRVDSIEHDIARIATAHEEDSGRLSSELAIMKARIEDALGAVAATVAELRATGTRAEAPSELQAMAPAVDEDALRASIRLGLEEAVDAARTEVAARLKQIRSEVETTVSTARSEFQSSFTGLLQGFETGLQSAREQAMAEIGKVREKLEPELKAAREEFSDEVATLRRDLVASEETFSGALRAFAMRLEGLQAQIAETGARQAAERASGNAGVQGVAQRIDGIEERMTEGLARLSEGILRVAENVGSAATLQRRIAALESIVAELQSKKRG